MAVTTDNVDEITVLVDIDDPLMKDENFLQSLKYGSYAEHYMDLDADELESIRSRQHRNPLFDRKFQLSIYTDRMFDFVQSVMVNSKGQERALIYILEEAEEIPNHEEALHLRQIYELRTIGPIRLKGARPLFEDDEDEDDENEAPSPYLLHNEGRRNIH